ncbi:MAG: RMD1 family protein [Flavisolibacter sp.]
MLEVLSYQLADSIDIKSFKSSFKTELHYNDSSELFYKINDNQFIYVFKYGVVCFLNHNQEEISNFLQKIAPFCKNLFKENLNEVFFIETNCRQTSIGYNKIEIVSSDVEVLRLIMMNVSQSVSLDYYSEIMTQLLEETNNHTQILEKRGKLDISGTNLKKFIGKTLLLKNRIAENLYIFDSPPETWDDENLNKIDTGLKKTFEIHERFRNISEGLQIIKDNLELFKDILQYRNSTVLEWIVIILIAVEVINLFLERLFK